MPVKKKTVPILWEWQDDEGDWQPFKRVDDVLLEENYKGKNMIFTTKFSFSKETYKLDLKKLTQTNQKTKVVRKLRRNEDEEEEEEEEVKTKEPRGKKAKREEEKWYFKNDDDEWQPFADVDAKMMESEYESRGEDAKFTTTDFSFNKKHLTPYLIDFSNMTQTNKKSKVSRELRRGEGDDEEADTTAKSAKKSKTKQADGKSEPPPGRAHLGEQVRAQAGGRVHFSGGLMWHEHVGGTASVPYVEDEMSEYVGVGRYPDNMKAFPKAIGASFDSVAVDAGTRCIIYSKPNFKGDVLWDKVGPALVVNVIWKDNVWPSMSPEKYHVVLASKWKEPLNSIFPPSVREFSMSDMHKWNTGSLVIEGGHPIPKRLKAKNPEYAVLTNPTY